MATMMMMMMVVDAFLDGGREDGYFWTSRRKFVTIVTFEDV